MLRKSLVSNGATTARRIAILLNRPKFKAVQGKSRDEPDYDNLQNG